MTEQETTKPVDHTSEKTIMSPEEEKSTLDYISGRLADVSRLLAMSPEERSTFDQDALEAARQKYYTPEGQSRLGNNDPNRTVEPTEADLGYIARTVENEIGILKAELTHLQALLGFKSF